MSTIWTSQNFLVIALQLMVQDSDKWIAAWIFLSCWQQELVSAVKICAASEKHSGIVHHNKDSCQSRHVEYEQDLQKYSTGCTVIDLSNKQNLIILY